MPIRLRLYGEPSGRAVRWLPPVTSGTEYRDPLEPQPHDTDVKALLRLAVVWNIPVACNRATADFMISSPLMTSGYQRQLPDYQAYVDRLVEPDGGD
jgi:hypothetical protein